MKRGRSLTYEDKEDRRCGCCNWEAVRLYRFKGQPKWMGLCATCFLDEFVIPLNVRFLMK